MELIYIEMDNREAQSRKDTATFLLNDTNFSHFKLSFKQLPVGDIITETPTLIGNVCIEIKDKGDFVASVIDGRLHTQIINMKNNFDVNVFILINPEIGLEQSNFNPNAYFGALGSIGSKHRCSVYQVNNDNEAIILAFYFLKHANLVPNDDINKIVRKGMTQEQREIASLSCVSGIGPELAARVIKKYADGLGEIALACQMKPNSFLTELQEIDGIGENKAVSIIKFYNRKWNKPEKIRKVKK